MFSFLINFNFLFLRAESGFVQKNSSATIKINRDTYSEKARSKTSAEYHKWICCFHKTKQIESRKKA